MTSNRSSPDAARESIARTRAWLARYDQACQEADQILATIPDRLLPKDGAYVVGPHRLPLALFEIERHLALLERNLKAVLNDNVPQVTTGTGPYR